MSSLAGIRMRIRKLEEQLEKLKQDFRDAVESLKK